ncbi:YiiD C-terminal domain-containing protein [Endozoicomonas sp. SCSIO W0465]|uniref:YiiD C-terminal domain-containing protein n=1 Tax=Endozoicomonas sp. SCSIO W0465 TaxID=2918516 RepID=UPI0020758A33|nr:YiiD C-terminal domain-containing protein [Endozoicomonas sp. SCSIO W0465]USE39431.1 thioesterase domain-containing protein [Endozoicomonas sp. SCSIO W0465]
MDINYPSPESLFTPELITWIKDNIPLLNNMAVSFDQFKDGELVISCPLTPNINDKGTAFGGSIAALATICGWLFTTLHARTRIEDCAAVIADSRLTYHVPGKGHISAHCNATVPDSFFDRLNERRNVKLELTVELYSTDKAEKSPINIATYKGIYVAMP